MKKFAIDNSSILYLALIRKHHTNIFRFTLTLSEDIQPELLQEAFTPEAVAAQLDAWISDAEARARASRALDGVMARLAATSAASPAGEQLDSAGGALGLAAREILEVAHAR